MSFKKESFYHPFTKSFLSFGAKEHSGENDTLSILQEIDLYYQPVEEPVTGISYLAIEIMVAVFSVFIQIKVFCLAKKRTRHSQRGDTNLFIIIADMFTLLTINLRKRLHTPHE